MRSTRKGYFVRWNSRKLAGKWCMPRGSILVMGWKRNRNSRRHRKHSYRRRISGDACRNPARQVCVELSENPFDLYLLDVSLPGNNGLELLRDIRTRDPHLPIILITAYGSIDMARAAFERRTGLHHQAVVNDELVAQVSAAAVEGRRLGKKRSAKARAERAL